VVAGVVHPRADAAADVIRYPAEVVARYSNFMSFRVAGQLIERDVRLGDRVRQGQVVARLEPSDAVKQSESARASLEAAEHRLLYAKQQLERDRAQAAQNLIATTQLEQTQDAYVAALAARDQATAQRTISVNALGYQSLKAEHDGFITSENADTGQVVSAGQQIYGLAWTGDTDVVLDAAASDLARIAVGQAATVTFPSLPGTQLHAHVREIAPAADPQSRTYRVKLTLLSPGKDVHLGMTGDVTLTPLAAVGVARASTDFEIPATALFHDGPAPAVWLIRSDSTLELRRVAVLRYEEQSVVLGGGLNDGDNIVLAGVHTVYAGERVQAVKPLFAADSKDPSGIAR
jgi:RND family efflux transporter MFP subunit